MIHKIEIEPLLKIAVDAGDAVIDVYNQNFDVELKSDLTPITEADRRSNNLLIEGLTQLYPDIPIISEESKHIPFKRRRDWQYFWLIDPLDGTKEFIKRNGEFTINIALIHKHEPVLGIIHIPEKHTTYFAKRNTGSYKIDETGQKWRIKAKLQTDKDRIVIAGSRSHASEELHEFVAEKRMTFKHVEFLSIGSSIKFCLVAEGIADVYLRAGQTMEWDTAAGHAIVIESGKQVYIYNTNDILTYNKETLKNKGFLVR